MPGPEVHRLALRHVPGEGAARLTRIGFGLASETYRVERDGASYSLRVARPAGRGAAFDAAWETGVRAIAGRAGLAPALVRADPAEGVLVCAWVEGRVWEAGAAAEPRRIAAIAGLMRAIHALPPPHPPRAVAPAEWIAAYERALGDGLARIAGDAAALRAGAARRLRVLEESGPAPRVLCHSDLHALNVVETQAGLIALDWEYAHVADPLWDPAGWCCMNDFADAERLALLESYLGRRPAAGERARFDALVWLYDYTCLLWSEAFLRQGADRCDPAVAARAGRLATRLAP